MFNIEEYIRRWYRRETNFPSEQHEQRNYETSRGGGGDATIRDIVQPICPQISPFLPTQGNIKGFHDLMELN